MFRLYIWGKFDAAGSNSDVYMTTKLKKRGFDTKQSELLMTISYANQIETFHQKVNSERFYEIQSNAYLLGSTQSVFPAHKLNIYVDFSFDQQLKSSEKAIR